MEVVDNSSPNVAQHARRTVACRLQDLVSTVQCFCWDGCSVPDLPFVCFIGCSVASEINVPPAFNHCKVVWPVLHESCAARVPAEGDRMQGAAVESSARVDQKLPAWPIFGSEPGQRCNAGSQQLSRGLS